MLDKTSTSVLKLLRKEFSEKSMEYMKYSEYYELCLKTLGISEPDAMGCINYLNEQGYTEDLNNRGFMLKHRTNHFEEFKRIDFIKYVKDNWIAFVALVISIAALVKSFFFSA